MAKHRNPIIVYIGFVLFFAAGIFLLYMGVTSVVRRAGYVKIEATVIDVEKYRDEDDDLLGRTTYEYYVDGVRYEKKASYSQSLSLCPMVGDVITIKYNKNDPNDVNDSPIILPIMFFVMGFAFGGTGGTLFVLTAMGKMQWVSANGGRRSHRRARRSYTNGGDAEAHYDESENTEYVASGDVIEAQNGADENTDSI